MYLLDWNILELTTTSATTPAVQTKKINFSLVSFFSFLLFKFAHTGVEFVVERGI